MKGFDRLLRAIVRLMVACNLLVFSPHLFGQAFEQGYQAFLSGDYQRARGLLNRGLQQSRDPYDRALMHKLLGISEFELGRTAQASSNFQRALQLDPNVTITREESRNRGVLQLFARVKQQSGAKAGGGGPRAQPSRGAQPRRGVQSRRGSRPAAGGRPAAGRGATQQTNSGNPIINLLPFGAGQFQQGKYFLGAALAVGQLGGLGVGIVQSSRANDADAQAAETIAEFEAGELDEGEFNQYLDDNEAFVLAARQESLIGFGLFAGLYLIGVAEAFLNPPKVAASMPARRRAAIMDAEELLRPGEVLDSLYLAEPSRISQLPPVQFHFDWRRGHEAGAIAFNFQLK